MLFHFLALLLAVIELSIKVFAAGTCTGVIVAVTAAVLLVAGCVLVTQYG